MQNRQRIHALIATAAVLTLGATGAAQAQTTTLTLSSWVPPTHYVVTDILQPWMAEVEKATEGRVKINLLPKPVGAPAQHWELARRGVADITWGNFTYEPERFKHVWFAELPMMGSSSEASSVALWRTFDRYLSKNEAFNGVTLLGTGMLGGGQFHHPSKVIGTPNDLRGQKVRMGGPIQKRLLEDLGAIPVAGPGTRAYELLEGGVIDASLHALESVVNFRLDGKLKNHTLIPGGLYDASFFIAINDNKFKRLSAADQQALLRVSGETLSRRWGQAFDKQNKAAEATLRTNGHTFGQPSPELVANIRRVRTAMLEELQKDGPRFGVSDHNAMVTFYEQQYQSLAR